MPRTTVRLRLLAVSVVALSCVKGEPLAPGPTVEAPVAGAPGASFSFADPVGDTLPGTRPGGARALDVSGVSGTISASEIVLRFEFTADVAPWSSARSNSVDGFVDFDVDENMSTGVPGAADEMGGSSRMGADYYLSLRDANGGTAVALVNTSTRAYVAVPAQFAGKTLTVRVSRALLGETDGRFRLGGIVGNGQRPLTDFVPNDGNYTVR